MTIFFWVGKGRTLFCKNFPEKMSSSSDPPTPTSTTSNAQSPAPGAAAGRRRAARGVRLEGPVAPEAAVHMVTWMALTKHLQYNKTSMSI